MTLAERLERLMVRRQALLRPRTPDFSPSGAALAAGPEDQPSASDYLDITAERLERRRRILGIAPVQTPREVEPRPPQAQVPPPLQAPRPEAAPPRPRVEPLGAALGQRLDTLLGSLGTPAPPPPGPRVTLPIEGEVHTTPLGPCFVVRQALDEAQRHGDRPLGGVLRWSGADAALLGRDAGLSGFDPRAAVFIDLETTALAPGLGNLPFLIGIAWFQGDRLIMEQWLLRDPDEELAALTEVARRLDDADWLVSYNGRTFDLPLLEGRFRLHHLPWPSVLGHLDLLPTCRRVLKHGLPNCRLGSVEEHHLGLRRVGDVAGSQVPAAWLEYQHGGAPHGLVGVVKHNREDVLSLVTLADLLLDRAARAESWVLRDPPSALALAACALAIGDCARAEAIYHAAAGFPATAHDGQVGLARVQRRRKRALKAEDRGKVL